MNTALIILFVYIAYIFVWLVINTIVYFFSIAFKKPRLLGMLSGLSIFALQVFNFLIGIGLLWLTISLLLNGEFLWFIVMIFFGIGLISGLLSYLQLPFVLINAYFASKLEKIDWDENITTAEILDEHNKVVGKIEGDTTVSIRLAKFFVIFYIMNLIWMIISPSEGDNYVGLDYVTTPAMQIFGGTVLFGIPYLIYHRIKHKSFFPRDKRYFFIQTWKLNVYILGSIGILLIVVGLLMGA